MKLPKEILFIYFPEDSYRYNTTVKFAYVLNTNLGKPTLYYIYHPVIEYSYDFKIDYTFKKPKPGVQVKYHRSLHKVSLFFDNEDAISHIIDPETFFKKWKR